MKYKCKDVVISEYFNEKIDFVEDRRENFTNKYYILDAYTRKSYHSDRQSGLWRFYIETLDDCLVLEKALICLHLCCCGETHIYPPVADGCQTEIKFEWL